MKDAPFSRLSIFALLASFAVHAAHVFFLPGTFVILLANIAILYVLTKRAASYAVSGRTDFDAIIAAETIVAFGVLSLILGLATALLPLAVSSEKFELGDPDQLKLLAVPFLEGLVTAGLAPFFAVVLRNLAFEADKTDDRLADMDSLARATGDLVRQLKNATSQFASLENSTRAAGVSTAGFAETLRAEVGRLETVLHEGQVHVRAFATAAGTGSTEVGKLADETRRMKESATEASTLLQALGALIDSVQRFIGPAAAK